MADLIHGDCLEVMRRMEPDSVDAIVTDPPYGLRFMGKEWDHGLPGVPFWEEALRVAKPGAHLLAFGGTRTHHRLMCAIEDAGWEIRDTLMWVYGSGFPKSHNLKGEHEGWGTALKPAWEPIIMARKPLCGTVAENVEKWGTGAINVDGCRIPVKDTRSGGFGKGHRPWIKGDIGNNTVYEDKLGRWPANLIHDGSEEVLAGFPKAPGQMGDVRGTENSVPGYSGGLGRSPFYGRLGDSGSAARFFYCAKASRAEREAGLEGMEVKHVTCRPLSDDEDDRTIQERLHGRKARNHHPTVKPLALMRYLCRLVTPPNGLILDPFAGSGTTGIAANLEGFRFVGIEKDQSYCEIAEKRLAQIRGIQGELIPCLA